MFPSVQDFKYQMINKFTSIDNSSLRQKQYKDLKGEIYLITASDHVWEKWETFFEAFEAGHLIDPDTNKPYNDHPRFKQMKPLVREFFRVLQGLTESEMVKAADYMLHRKPTARRCWTHPKIAMTKPKTFVPSCYQFKDWADNRKYKKSIVRELSTLVKDRDIFVDGEVHEVNWRAFKKEYNFTSASMAALIREAGEEFLRLKKVKGGKNIPLPVHAARAFSNFIKEKRIVKFEGDALFNPVTFDPLKIQGWPGVEARKAIRLKAGDRFPFGLIDWRLCPGAGIEGSLSSPFYEPFLTKFLEYGCPRFREVDIWLWIVEDRRAEQVYEVVRRLQPDYAVSKSHYSPAPAEGLYSVMKDKKTKRVESLCLFFVYKAELVRQQNHPISRMESLFQVPDALGNDKRYYDEAKYANYPAGELRMDFYLRVLRVLTQRGDCIFNVFGGSKMVYAALVSENSLLNKMC